MSYCLDQPEKKRHVHNKLLYVLIERHAPESATNFFSALSTEDKWNLYTVLGELLPISSFHLLLSLFMFLLSSPHCQNNLHIVVLWFLVNCLYSNGECKGKCHMKPFEFDYIAVLLFVVLFWVVIRREQHNNIIVGVLWNISNRVKYIFFKNPKNLPNCTY